MSSHGVVCQLSKHAASLHLKITSIGACLKCKRLLLSVYLALGDIEGILNYNFISSLSVPFIS